MLFLFFFSVLMVVNAELSKTNEINNHQNHKAMPMKRLGTWKELIYCIDKLKTFACLFSDSNCRTNIENGLMELKRLHRNNKNGLMEKSKSVPEVIFDLVATNAIFWILLFGWLIFIVWTCTIHQPNVDFVPLLDYLAGYLIELY